MSQFFYSIAVPFAIFTYTLLLATVILGILKYKLHVRISPLIHKITAILCLLFASFHGGLHLYWNNGILNLPLAVGLVPYVLVAVNVVFALTRLAIQKKMELHMWIGITALLIASGHAVWMLAIRYSFK